MKKSLWILSALALVGFAFTGCSNDCETADDCADGEYCIEALYAAAGGNDDTDSVEVGDMFCSACPVDCDPASQYPVCVASVHACAAQASCPAGQQFQVNGNTASCISDSVKSCNADTDCENGWICGASKVCEPKAADEFKYVRIDDMSDDCTTKKTCEEVDPGADIDAVVLTKADGAKHYAVGVAGYLRSDKKTEKDSYTDKNGVKSATDPTKALNEPDSFTGYPNADGKCVYFTDANKTEHPYVSLGGKGGYVALEMGAPIVAGDKIDVLEVGSCELTNTKDGGKQVAKSEAIQLQVSVSKDSGWKVIGSKTADDTNKGILSFTISDNMLK